ncbi:MAG: antirestriction protein ArdA, partial [Erysipelotrichaceae bacterium]|nr:antirestriction protein ArdA [Erysipelotrichaceae bacterium]
EITDQLEAGIQELFESDKFKDYLTCMSKFHNYSLNNTILIAMQKPDATLVAGYKAWQTDHGRTVRKGEHGIKILAPCKFKVTVESDENGTLENSGNDEKTKVMEYLRFKITHVFDVSQTEGKELPSIGIDELTGDVREYRSMYKALVRTCPVAIVMEEIEGGAKGYYNDTDKRIAILAGMSEMQTIKTIIHEMAHQKMHGEENADPEHPVDRRTKEVEAESVAYTVCQHLSLDTSDYSFGYIAGWSSTRDTKELKASLERIRSTSDELINEIDKNLEHFRKREQEKLRGEER